MFAGDFRSKATMSPGAAALVNVPTAAPFCDTSVTASMCVPRVIGCTFDAFGPASGSS